jgi:hypothetical protein
VTAKVTFSGLAPHEIGVPQADIQVPATRPGGPPRTAGDYPVFLNIGGVVRNTGLTSIPPLLRWRSDWSTPSLFLSLRMPLPDSVDLYLAIRLSQISL